VSEQPARTGSVAEKSPGRPGSESLNLVLFAHPSFMNSQSMARFASWLQEAFEARGHAVRIWSPKNYFHGLLPTAFSKWAGYVDQYIVFPIQVRRRLKRISRDTLFVFCDQALGPWVPLVKNRPHVIHVHDLLALRSALGELAENPTSMTGRCYQRFIRRGFRQGRNFIAISIKTRDDLYLYGGITPTVSEVVYNGLNFAYSPLSTTQSRQVLQGAGLPAPSGGMLLHVGGGQWYKNLIGVIKIYARYAAHENDPLPLWCITPKPDDATTLATLATVPSVGRVRFLQNVDNTVLQAMYSLSRAFLFPSFAEGFGWPIVEALACGCPVITTGEAPMNEVAGDAASYVPRLRLEDDVDAWAENGASTVKQILARSNDERELAAQRGIERARVFDSDKAIERYLSIYRRVLDPCSDQVGLRQDVAASEVT
jgi:glycosyltransferase involved in cell wall biosynthesis